MPKSTTNTPVSPMIEDLDPADRQSRASPVQRSAVGTCAHLHKTYNDCLVLISKSAMTCLDKNIACLSYISDAYAYAFTSPWRHTLILTIENDLGVSHTQALSECLFGCYCSLLDYSSNHGNVERHAILTNPSTVAIGCIGSRHSPSCTSYFLFHTYAYTIFI